MLAGMLPARTRLARAPRRALLLCGAQFVVFALHGCGRVAFEIVSSDASTTDGAVVDGDVDAAIDAGSFDTVPTFDMPQLIATVSTTTGNEDDPTVSEDLLELY